MQSWVPCGSDLLTNQGRHTPLQFAWTLPSPGQLFCTTAKVFDAAIKELIYKYWKYCQLDCLHKRETIVPSVCVGGKTVGTVRIWCVGCQLYTAIFWKCHFPPLLYLLDRGQRQPLKGKLEALSMTWCGCLKLFFFF